MEAPQTFTDRLHTTFDGRLRIRWSTAEQQFVIEQRVGRAVVAPIRIAEDRDDLIRARDGYHPVMTITAGDRMRCPTCHYELKVPVRGTHDIRCGFCALHGRTTRVVAGFWPLDDALLTHLQHIDPLNDYQDEIAEAADRSNRMLLKSQEDQISNDGYAALEERYNNIVGIESVGFTGKEFKEAA